MARFLKQFGILITLGMVFAGCVKNDLDRSIPKAQKKPVMRGGEIAIPTGKARRVFNRESMKARRLGSQAEEMAQKVERNYTEFQIVMTEDEVAKLCDSQAGCFHVKTTGAYYIKGYEKLYTVSETGVMRTLFVKKGYKYNHESQKVYDSTNNIVAEFDHTKISTQVAFNIDADSLNKEEKRKNLLKRKSPVRLVIGRRDKRVKRVFERPGISKNKESMN